MRNILAIIGLIAIISAAAFCVASCTDFSSTNIAYSGERIGLIHINGIITTEKNEMNAFMPSGGSDSETVVQQLDEARKDPNVKAVVIRVNSPGGSAAGSQEIFQAINRFKGTGRKVIVSMGDVAASGGYYVAAPADIIYANAATLTGSIGVIMQIMNYEGLFDKIGLDDVTLKAGKYKDIGNPNRPMTEEEKAILQNILTEVHSQFKQAVMEGRKMTQAEVDQLATGEIWSGRQAKDKKLVDEVGSFKDALDRAAKEGGLNVDDYVVSPLGEGSIFDEIMKGFKMTFSPTIQIGGMPSNTSIGLYTDATLLRMTMQ
jgi:protease-4